MKLRLLDWDGSPFCLKVRAILDYKGLSYDREQVLAGTAYLELIRRGHARKVPALDIDGRLVEDSTEIAHEIDRLVPEPSLFPAEPRARALCHALEDWSDEALYFPGLYFQWIDPEGAEHAARGLRRHPFGRVVHPLYRRRIRGQVVGQGTGRKTPEHVVRDLERSLDAVETLLDPGPWLLGDGPFLCDFAMLGQLVYLSRPPGSAPMIERRKAIRAFLDRMKALRAAAVVSGPRTR